MAKAPKMETLVEGGFGSPPGIQILFDQPRDDDFYSIGTYVLLTRKQAKQLIKDIKGALEQ